MRRNHRFKDRFWWNNKIWSPSNDCVEEGVDLAGVAAVVEGVEEGFDCVGWESTLKFDIMHTQKHRQSSWDLFGIVQKELETVKIGVGSLGTADQFLGIEGVVTVIESFNDPRICHDFWVMMNLWTILLVIHTADITKDGGDGIVVEIAGVHEFPDQEGDAGGVDELEFGIG